MSTVTAKPAFELPPTATMTAALRRWWWLIAAFVLVYGQILASLVQEWWTNDDYSHGFLIPFALAYLLYEKRAELFAITPKPSAFGFVTILASQAVLIVGFLGAEFFLQRVSMVMFAGGLILFFWGWRMLMETAFGLVLILLAIPLPAIIFNAIALPLQLLASAWAESFLRVCQIPVYRDGNILQLSQQLLNVTEACSGIRSLMSLVTLATMLAYFLPMRWWARLAFIFTSVPIALAANAFRVAGTGLLARWFGEQAAQGFFHSFSGWLVFVFAFVVLLAELFLLQRFAAPRKKVS
ncbi:MAG TPA: exosortase [Terriglobales bacterium]|nr:exosortase [Terriglobales bacterium]